MATHSALELLVWPTVLGVGGALAFFALLKVIQLAISLLIQGHRHRRRAAAEAAGPYRPIRPRTDRARVRVEMTR